MDDVLFANSSAKAAFEIAFLDAGHGKERGYPGLAKVLGQQTRDAVELLGVIGTGNTASSDISLALQFLRS